MTDIWISLFSKRRQGLTLQMMVPEVLQKAIKLGFTFKGIKVFLIVNLHIREDSGFHVLSVMNLVKDQYLCRLIIRQPENNRIQRLIS